MNRFIFGFFIICVIVLTPFAQVSAGLIPSPIVPNCNTGPLVPRSTPENPIYKYDSNNKKIPITENGKENGKPKLDANNQPMYELSDEKHFAQPCDFSYVMLLINNVIQFLLFGIATPLAALVIMYAGFQLLFSGGSSEAKTKAKNVIKNLIVGYIIALAAWLIVNTIFKALGFTGTTFLKP